MYSVGVVASLIVSRLKICLTRASAFFPTLTNDHRLLQKTGDIDEHIMYNTYNMGIGMVIAVDPGDTEKALRALEAAGETAYEIGIITIGEKGVALV